MKRSEYVAREIEKAMEEAACGPAAAAMIAHANARASERAGVTWDLEEAEPEVLWPGERFMLRTDGWFERSGSSPWRQIIGPDEVIAELARRILLDRELGGDVTYWHGEAKKLREDVMYDLVAAAPRVVVTVPDSSLRQQHDRTLRRLAELSGIAHMLAHFSGIERNRAIEAYVRWVNAPE
jgi:hypothetical protein